jgi:hypothetical protein
MNMTAFWNIALCSVVKANGVSEVLTASIIRKVSDHPDRTAPIILVINYCPYDGGSKHL